MSCGSRVSVVSGRKQTSVHCLEKKWQHGDEVSSYRSADSLSVCMKESQDSPLKQIFTVPIPRSLCVLCWWLSWHWNAGLLARKDNQQEMSPLLLKLLSITLFSFFLKLLIYSHVHTLFRSFLPPPSPHFQAEPVLPLSLILLKKWLKHTKEDKAFLLVEIRIATQRDYYYCFHV
jgi:hypothetical protein